MPKLMKRNCTFRVYEGEHAGLHTLQAGEMMPEWAETHVTNPAAFEEIPEHKTGETAATKPAKKRAPRKRAAKPKTSVLIDDLDEMTIPQLADAADKLGITFDDKEVTDKAKMIEKIREARG